MDTNAAKKAFIQYLNLNDANLDIQQIYFVNQIVEYILYNGVIKDLYVLQEPPFTDQGSVVEMFTDLSLRAEIKSAIDRISANTEAGETDYRKIQIGPYVLKIYGGALPEHPHNRQISRRIKRRPSQHVDVAMLAVGCCLSTRYELLRQRSIFVPKACI